MQSPRPEPPPRIRILFVDDEQNLLDGLRRGMHSMRAEWDMSFAISGAEALALMQQGAPDVVVSDMRMPGMNGRDLLMEVQRLYPQTVRFVLSGYAESASVMQVAGTAHQYLSKPCESAALKVALARTVALRKLLDDKQLIRRIGKVDALPSLPRIYQQIVSCLQTPEPQLADVARIISADLAMTAMVLKLANSAFFGAKQSFRTTDRAVPFLGLETIAGLVLAHSLFNEFAVAENSGLSMEQLWQHSLKTAKGARVLARYENWNPECVEEAFLAGALHDLGKLVLASRPAEVTDEVSMTLPDRIPASVDDNHAAVGAYLLGLWGFSDTFVEAIAFHHTPSKATVQELGLAGLLHIADRLAHHSGEGQELLTEADLESGYLESIGLSGRLVDWQTAWAKAFAEEK